MTTFTVSIHRPGWGIRRASPGIHESSTNGNARPAPIRTKMANVFHHARVRSHRERRRRARGTGAEQGVPMIAASQPFTSEPDVAAVLLLVHPDGDLEDAHAR